jgi:hypothetical protein
MTMNGVSRTYVTPSTETCRSSIASSRADWVFGLARLISSPEHQVGEDRAGLELELPTVLVVDRHAR